MGILKDSDKEEILKMFEELDSNITIEFFTQEHECRFCSETRELLTDVAALSDKIVLKVLDFEKDKARADALGIDKIPGFSVIGKEDNGIRFFGIPSGYEFTSFIHSLLMVSKGDSELSGTTKTALNNVTKPVHLQVFVTPT
jgi:alkyl hydroperoxide reductase subunit AhpF